MNSPLVSIVIPTFERPELLERACETACSQTYDNIEIIVVDDDSQVSYEKALEKLSTLKNFKYIKRSKNGGGSAARNTGIEAANGEFIAFLDDDDTWDISKIQKQMNSIGKTVRAAHCGYKLLSSGTNRVEPYDVIGLKELSENNKLASTTGLLCETSILRDLKFDESLHRSQDWDLYLRIAKVTNFAYVKEALYVYDDGDHARMSNRFSKLTIEQYKLKLDMLKKHQNTLIPDAYRKHVADLILPSLKNRQDKIEIIKFCINEIGILSTSYHLIRIIFNKLIR